MTNIYIDRYVANGFRTDVHTEIWGSEATIEKAQDQADELNDELGDAGHAYVERY